MRSNAVVQHHWLQTWLDCQQIKNVRYLWKYFKYSIATGSQIKRGSNQLNYANTSTKLIPNIR